jgi:hypothetical protein
MSLFFLDPASGVKGGDDFAAAKARQQGDLSVLEAVRVWHPPFSPAAVVEECAAWIRSCGESEGHGDRWSGDLVREMFQIQGVNYIASELDKGQIYLAFLPLVNSGRVRLLDHPELMRQLRGLERRRGWGGRDRVDHRRGAHDDLANAAAGAIVLVAQGRNFGMWFQRPGAEKKPAPEPWLTPAEIQVREDKRLKDEADAQRILEERERTEIWHRPGAWTNWSG